MFNFLEMASNYENRKVDRFEGDNFFISTAWVNDSVNYPYETAISHPDYDNKRVIVIEQYEDIEEAKINHQKWVETFTKKELPEYLIECFAGDIAEACLDVGIFDIDHRIYRKDQIK